LAFNSIDRRNASAQAGPTNAHTRLALPAGVQLTAMEIRPATPEDVPQVLPMVRKIAAFHQAADPAKYSFRADPGETYRNWLRKRATDPRSVFLVADARQASDPEPRLVAFLVGTVEPEVVIYQVAEFGFIHDVWVDERYRHEGIGRQFVALAVERFRAIGVRQVRLDVLATNDPARGLFASAGFRPSVTEMLIEL
jgi:ribosomal protein S18 acetylase RimI-like enzyme